MHSLAKATMGLCEYKYLKKYFKTWNYWIFNFLF